MDKSVVNMDKLKENYKKECIEFFFYHKSKRYFIISNYTKKIIIYQHTSVDDEFCQKNAVIPNSVQHINKQMTNRNFNFQITNNLKCCIQNSEYDYDRYEHDNFYHYNQDDKSIVKYQFKYNMSQKHLKPFKIEHYKNMTNIIFINSLILGLSIGQLKNKFLIGNLHLVCLRDQWCRNRYNYNYDVKNIVILKNAKNVTLISRENKLNLFLLRNIHNLNVDVYNRNSVNIIDVSTLLNLHSLHINLLCKFPNVNKMINMKKIIKSNVLQIINVIRDGNYDYNVNFTFKQNFMFVAKLVVNDKFILDDVFTTIRILCVETRYKTKLNKYVDYFV